MVTDFLVSWFKISFSTSPADPLLFLFIWLITTECFSSLSVKMSEFLLLCAMFSIVCAFYSKMFAHVCNFFTILLNFVRNEGDLFLLKGGHLA